ncbi:MAG: hypothetical protein ACOYJ2_02145 [Rickettsiales bacterium]
MRKFLMIFSTLLLMSQHAMSQTPEATPNQKQIEWVQLCIKHYGVSVQQVGETLTSDQKNVVNQCLAKVGIQTPKLPDKKPMPPEDHEKLKQCLTEQGLSPPGEEGAPEYSKDPEKAKMMDSCLKKIGVTATTSPAPPVAEDVGAPKDVATPATQH